MLCAAVPITLSFCCFRSLAGTLAGDGDHELFKVTLGDAVVKQARFVALWWDSRVIPDRHNVALSQELSEVPHSSGVYAVTGRHDARSGQGVLYVGRADDLPTRIVTSVQDSLSEQHANGQRTLFSDVWDLTVRWARVSTALLTSIERLLIMSHSPPFNSQLVRRVKPTDVEHDLIVMNAGRKGPILPVIAGAYQADGWENSAGPIDPVHHELAYILFRCPTLGIYSSPSSLDD